MKYKYNIISIESGTVKNKIQLILLRVIQSFSATYILCEHGLQKDAESTARNLLVEMFLIIGIINDKNLSYEHDSHSYYEKRKMLEQCLNNISNCKTSLQLEESTSKIREYITEFGKHIKRPIKLSDKICAEKAKLVHIYDLYYRMWSDSCHCGLLSLVEKLFSNDGSVVDNLEWGPEFTDADKILLPCCVFILLIIDSLSNFFVVDKPNEFDELSSLIQKKCPIYIFKNM